VDAIGDSSATSELCHATSGDLLDRPDRPTEAATASRRTPAPVTNSAERDVLERRPADVTNPSDRRVRGV
jgi:predicted RNA polymerase sigma factor